MPDISRPSTPATNTSPLIGPALTAGFTATLGIWIIWWVTHLPGITTPAPAVLLLLLLALVTSLTLTARASARPIAVGLFGGGVAGVLNLLILGSVLSVQAENTEQMNEVANRFHDNAATIAAGYLALTVFAGLVAGLIGRATRRARTIDAPTAWLSRFAVLTVFSFVPLIAVGGAVTSTASGMAVPDGVTSYGAFSALLPMSIMAEPRIFLEHTHRLLGTLVGLTAIALMLYTLAVERRRLPKVFAVVLLLLVIIQGVFGAIRVDASLSSLAAVHGVLAQLVFGFAVLTAARLSVLDREPPASLDEATAHAARRSVRLTHLAAGAMLIQLVFGALARHSENPSHAIWSHAVFSIVVVALFVFAAAALSTAGSVSRPGRLLRTIGRLLTIAVFAQFVLGFLTLWQVGLSGEPRTIHTAETLAEAPPINILKAIITTSHQSLGAALLALIVLGLYWSKRLHRVAVSGKPS